MPQRKTHDVYSGNQKVGEVWEHYDVFTPAERAEQRAKRMAEAIKKSLDESRLLGTAEYQAKAAKAERNFKVRKALGIIAVIGAIGLIVFSLAFPQSPLMSEWTMFYLSPIAFGIGMGLTHSDAELNLEKKRPTIPLGWCIGWTIGGGIGFFVLNLMILFAVAQLNII